MESHKKCSKPPTSLSKGDLFTDAPVGALTDNGDSLLSKLALSKVISDPIKSYLI